MSSTLPYAADAESPLKREELQVLREEYEEDGIFVSVQIKFNYAWGLIKSDNRSEQLEGVRLLSDIFRTSPERRRECLYYLALGYYKLGFCSEAKHYNNLLLEKEPENMQATRLRSIIDDQIKREGIIGASFIGGLVLVAGLFARYFLKSMK